MTQNCRLCGQSLPKGMSHAELHKRMDKLGADAARREGTKIRRELDREYRARLAEQEEHLQKRASKEAHASYRSQLAALERKVKDSDRRSRQEAERAAKEIAKQSRKEIELVNDRAARERAQHTAATVSMKAKLDALSLKLERQSSEQLGEMGEADVYAALRNAFLGLGDDIQRVGRGLRGADIVHRVLAHGKELGRIVYECKNVSTWQNSWVAKAKKCLAHYQTPWVIIATRTFPRRQKWFVVDHAVPVIDLRLVVRLAEIVRAAVLEIGHLRTSQVGRHNKAEQIFDYILSDHFAGRFTGIADAVSTLREEHTKERQWHADARAKHQKHFSHIDESRRDIDVRIRGISRAVAKGTLQVVTRN